VTRVRVAKTDLPTLLAALDDASWYRNDDGDCVDCVDCRYEVKETGDPAAKCGDHEADAELAAEYQALYDRYRLYDKPDSGRPEIHGWGWIGALWQMLTPAGWATQWYWPAGTHGRVYNFFHGKGWNIT